MIIALFADPASALPVAERFESRGHACILAASSIPGEADCVVVVGDAGANAGLVEAAEEAGLPVLRLSAENAPPTPPRPPPGASASPTSAISRRPAPTRA